MQELDTLRKYRIRRKTIPGRIAAERIPGYRNFLFKNHFNNVFGYYLEVTNAQKHKVPETWIRKQTLANAERYITPELKEYEEKITGAEEKIQMIEAGIYDKLLYVYAGLYCPHTGKLFSDGYSGLPALLCGKCPSSKLQKTSHSGRTFLELKESRHPVIEKNLSPGRRIYNQRSDTGSFQISRSLF